MLVFTTFSSALISNEILQIMILNQLWIPIFFGSITLAFIIAMYPIRRGLMEFSKKKENKISAFIYAVLILLIFYTEVPYFLADPHIMFNTLFPVAIKNPEDYQNAIYLKTMAQFIALPLISAFNFSRLKNTLKKHDCITNDTLQNNKKFVFYMILMGIIMYGLTMLLGNMS